MNHSHPVKPVQLHHHTRLNRLRGSQRFLDLKMAAHRGITLKTLPVSPSSYSTQREGHGASLTALNLFISSFIATIVST